MSSSTPELLDADLLSTSKISRKKLLPIWIKVFAWIFLIMGCISVIGFPLGLMGMTFDFALYGLSATQPLSLVGASIIILFMLKGIASYGLLFEKDWGVKLALADAILGILVCTFLMLIAPLLRVIDGIQFSFRFELVLLIPYLLKMQSIKKQWDDAADID
jgi:hypothetical protein